MKYRLFRRFFYGQTITFIIVPFTSTWTAYITTPGFDTLEMAIQLFACPLTGKPVELLINEVDVVGIGIEVVQSPPLNDE